MWASTAKTLSPNVRRPRLGYMGCVNGRLVSQHRSDARQKKEGGGSSEGCLQRSRQPRVLSSIQGLLSASLLSPVVVSSIRRGIYLRDNEGSAKNRSVRIKTWKEFKNVVAATKPKSIVYVIAKSIPARDLTSLKLILPVAGTQYIFVDSAKEDTLRQTGLPIHVDKDGHRFLEDNDIKAFLKTQLRRKDLQVFSYWTA